MKETRLGRELVAGLREAVAHARGAKKLRASTLEIPAPAPVWPRKRIAELRKRRFHVSQPVFAALLSVKLPTVRAWEQGQKTPSGAACRLLQLAELDPRVFQRLAHAVR